MKPLSKALRSQLERTVLEARDVAEAAASAGLKQLGVDEKAPFPHLSESERELRRRLRTRGRQLGDTLNGEAEQNMNQLVEEVAYEHWHRMLFARFLSENNLLMCPDPNGPVPVTLEECDDLALKKGCKSGWELAARFAAHMLPQIFRLNSPVFQLCLPPEHQQRLEKLMDELPIEVFKASDSLGWVYQFWQAKRKDEVNDSAVKIGARELPVVTQLFTEPYMVNFLLDNSLGAWWASHKLTKNDLLNAESEEELRKKASLPDIPLEYLRFIKGEGGLWNPAAGTFTCWPENLSEFKILDPCCGSGHFLVAAFLMLVPIRMELEGLSAKDAVDAVLSVNLHGLEIDKRCVELAAFALAFAAWRYPDSGGYRQLPELNIACSGLSPNAKKEEWIALAEDNSNLKYSLSQLYDQFKDAQTLGSLINLDVALGKGTLNEIKLSELYPILTKALSEGDELKKEIGIMAKGIAKAAQLLSNKYYLILTNVPYLAVSKQSDILYSYCKKYHNDAKHDLATVFLDRCFHYCYDHGACSIVMPYNWLFLKSYEKFRQRLLRDHKWRVIALLGPKAFKTPMWDFNVQLLILSRGFADKKSWIENENGKNLIKGLDVFKVSSVIEKAAKLITVQIKSIDQAKQLNNPGTKVTLEEIQFESLLNDCADVHYGSKPGQTVRVTKQFWEISSLRDILWVFMESSPSRGQLFSGKSEICYSLETIKRLRVAAFGVRGSNAWGQKGLILSKMSNLPFAIYLGKFFDDNTCVIIPRKPEDCVAILCSMIEGKFLEAVRSINKKVSVTKETLENVPFDINFWRKFARDRYPRGLPKPYSDDPTQWIFHGYPVVSNEPLQVATLRLLGYRWPAETDSKIEISDEAHELVKRSEELLPFMDEDGIVCIPSVRGESRAEDRLEKLLATAYGSHWDSIKRDALLSKVAYSGKTIESWLREKFFCQHCALFSDRPFIWHIWDGLSDGFAALVNYHKLDHKKLETLIYTYLGDWISRQKQDKANGVDGAEEKLAAAEGLKKRLELILEGEAPYDIFVRWKPLEKQPIGWNPDLNDGVRLNIRPFMSVPDVGKKGAGVLRDRPNIKWGKDRGRDVESAPWYKLFKGERINDHHLSLAEKKKAKEKIK